MKLERKIQARVQALPTYTLSEAAYHLPLFRCCWFVIRTKAPMQAATGLSGFDEEMCCSSPWVMTSVWTSNTCTPMSHTANRIWLCRSKTPDWNLRHRAPWQKQSCQLDTTNGCDQAAIVAGQVECLVSFSIV